MDSPYMRLATALLVCAVMFTLILHDPALAAWQIDLESGVVWSGYNDVQIPKNSGTRFSLTDDLQTESPLFFRLRLEYALTDRHTLGLLFAPLSLRATGTIDRSLRFEGTEFPEAARIDALYKFNSYRVTYRYTVHRSRNLSFGFGFTGKVRDAAVVLEIPGLRAEKANVGFVPLLNFMLEYQLARHLRAILHGDALAAPQGRAEDVSVMLAWKASDIVEVKGGYRFLEGGADVDEVYNFAMLHYLSIGMQISVR